VAELHIRIPSWLASANSGCGRKPAHSQQQKLGVLIFALTLKLRCYVVVELKTTPFKPEYAGQLNF
jgi:hypothetical protein